MMKSSVDPQLLAHSGRSNKNCFVLLFSHLVQLYKIGLRQVRFQKNRFIKMTSKCQLHHSVVYYLKVRTKYNKEN
jgi:hypothetical protein